MRLVQIRRDINVGRAEKLQQLVFVHEAIEENYVFLDTILFGKALQAEPVGFTVVPNKIRMSRAKNYVNDIGKLAYDC